MKGSIPSTICGTGWCQGGSCTIASAQGALPTKSGKGCTGRYKLQGSAEDNNATAYGFASEIADVVLTVKDSSGAVVTVVHGIGTRRMNSIDASAKPRCADLTPANAASSAEQVGFVVLTLINDDTGAPAKYQGGLWYLSYDEATQTATLCGLARAGGSVLPSANREIMFQLLLRADGGGGLPLTWNFAAVPGETRGSRSIIDNDYFAGTHTSVLWTRIEINTLTAGKYHTDPSGKKTPVRFVWNPAAQGPYSFRGLFTPCESLGNCTPGAPPAVRTSIIRITDYPTGYHPGVTITAPAMWTVARGGAPIALKWQPPSTSSPSDLVRGYAIMVTADYVPDSTKSLYFVTDPAESDVSTPNPCGTDGKATECATTLGLPYRSDAGIEVPEDNSYSMMLVTVFKDGHRSDGLCDDGTARGSVAPCPNNTVPAFTSTGIARSQFLYRERAWPLTFRETRRASKAAYGTWQIFILMADLDAHSFEFITWKPMDRSYQGGGLTVTGSNASGGAIEFHQTVGAQHWYLDAYVTSSSASGLWVLTSSTNDIQDMYRFSMRKA